MAAVDHLGRQWSVQHRGEHLFGGEYATVHAPSGEAVGHMRFRTGDDPFVPVPGHTFVEYVNVDSEHRGQGAARALYQGVHAHTERPFVHSRDDMTPEARKTVTRLAAENPGVHREIAFKKGGGRDWDRGTVPWAGERKPRRR